MLDKEFDKHIETHFTSLFILELITQNVGNKEKAALLRGVVLDALKGTWDAAILVDRNKEALDSILKELE